MGFGDLLGKAKGLLKDKDKLSSVVDQATDLLDKHTDGKFADQLSKLDDAVADMKPSDLDQLDSIAGKLDQLDEKDMEKLKSVIGKIAEEKPEKLGEADVEKLQGIAEKLGIAPPKG